MTTISEKPLLDFCLYPPVGEEDWRYAFASAQVKSLQTFMLGRTLLQDMANAIDFSQSVDLLSATEYPYTQETSIEQINENLLEKRKQVRNLFCDLVVDKGIAELLKARSDFANLRLALRRKLTEKPIGVDYCSDGFVPASEFESVFEQENYAPLPIYMREAIEAAVLAYYQNKDIRQIDYALDAEYFRYIIAKATELKNDFLIGLYRMRADLTNIRTMLRLKYRQAEELDGFVPGGYVDESVLKHCVNLDYDSIKTMFFSTPYYELVEAGVGYLVSDNSFLKVEQRCDSYIAGYLESGFMVTAGSQPLIAYLLLKEDEIRNVRLVLTGKKNLLDPKLILDRLAD